jgi:hypothetical protein
MEDLTDAPVHPIKIFLANEGSFNAPFHLNIENYSTEPSKSELVVH